MNTKEIDRRSFLAGTLKASASMAVASLVPGIAVASTDKNFKTYKTIDLTRTPEGVVIMKLHTNQKEFILTLDAYQELADAFDEVNKDFDNKVLLLTGTGSYFIKEADFTTFGDLSKPAQWYKISALAKRMLKSAVGVQIPVISAVNGPTPLRSEMALLADVVIADENAWFQDNHLQFGVAPGDGIFAVWSRLLGVNRARQFLLLGKKLSAREALDYGVITELANGKGVYDSALKIATSLAAKPTITLRSSRQLMTGKLASEINEEMSATWPLEELSALSK
ncbi:enoyl-CoA hydratase/isomerase family protein [Mucilaginibacter jinjuensis]|uniref:Enoyl-CoA hydratase/isomerase family protein n=1 Tax=Mucilaginibacter jinjuensis TaxID=1176721 RepID=A0ABY7TD53_9SPHI|nr:enoyl-CoA hydratase/isomerase family protein [Mucilaginibacter jinjuensis]WCT14283.1 enoyl-CoA hydratase/isomerase family protein [Mucilaginibacter jinjuensis]